MIMTLKGFKRKHFKWAFPYQTLISELFIATLKVILYQKTVNLLPEPDPKSLEAVWKG